MDLTPHQKYHDLPWLVGIIVLLVAGAFNYYERNHYDHCGTELLAELETSEYSPYTKDITPITTLPFFPGCPQLSGGEKRVCSQRNLQTYLHAHAGYPTGSWTHATAGLATIQIWIDANGLVSNHRMYKGPGLGRGEDLQRIIDEMITDKVRWEPATVNGQPVTSSVMVSLKYNLVWGGAKKYTGG